jgi:hypothetical protein
MDQLHTARLHVDSMVTCSAVLDVREDTVFFLARLCGYATASWAPAGDGRRWAAAGRR